MILNSCKFCGSTQGEAILFEAFFTNWTTCLHKPIINKCILSWSSRKTGCANVSPLGLEVDIFDTIIR